MEEKMRSICSSTYYFVAYWVEVHMPYVGRVRQPRSTVINEHPFLYFAKRPSFVLMSWQVITAEEYRGYQC